MHPERPTESALSAAPAPPVPSVKEGSSAASVHSDASTEDADTPSGPVPMSADDDLGILCTPSEVISCFNGELTEIHQL